MHEAQVQGTRSFDRKPTDPPHLCPHPFPRSFSRTIVVDEGVDALVKERHDDGEHHAVALGEHVLEHRLEGERARKREHLPIPVDAAREAAAEPA